ncbi:MAG: glycosyltransferase family 2 protein [bacterium]|nr:glycosyltransferase family 2 protein [bacterium]
MNHEPEKKNHAEEPMDISVVVISYNSGKFLEKNIDSMVNQEVPFREIILVDNGSTDNSLDIIESFAARVATIRSIPMGYNSGYAKGANTGIAAAGASLVLIANSDTILEPDFNGKVLQKFHQNPDISMLSPLLLRFDKQTVDSAGQTYSRSLHPKEIGFNRHRDSLTITEGPVFSVCGAATVFTRTALEKLNIDGDYYDEDFFIFLEDFDIGWRANLLGLKTLFYPDAVVFHFRSATLEANPWARFSLAMARPPFIKYHLVKNRYLTLIKNFRFSTFYTSIPFIILKDIIWVGLLTFSSPKIIIKLMKSGNLFGNAFRKRRILKQLQRADKERTP